MSETPPPAASAEQKWTEIEHLPEWDEEFYHVYTAKKHGKWTMLKTLRPELKDDPKFMDMIEKEFDVRYNLAHPAIVMINDFEDVPGLGRCIITDDVYGDSLRKLIDEKRVTNKHIDRLCTQMVSALDYIQANHIVHHPVRAERVIFTQNIENLKLIDVGFDQREHLTPADAAEDIYNYGLILTEALDAAADAPAHLRKVAEKCTNPNPASRYKDIQSLKLALDNRKPNRLLLLVIAFLVLMIILLTWLNSPWAPKHPDNLASATSTTLTITDP